MITHHPFPQVAKNRLAMLQKPVPAPQTPSEKNIFSPINPSGSEHVEATPQQPLAPSEASGTLLPKHRVSTKTEMASMEECWGEM